MHALRLYNLPGSTAAATPPLVPFGTITAATAPNTTSFLMGLPELRTLWLEGNPVALHPHYREAVLVNLRQVTTLDDRPVTESERDAAAAALPHELWLLCCGAGEDAQEGAVASGRGCSSGGIAKDVPSPALSRESKRVTALYDDNSCDVESFWMEQALQLPPHEDRQQDAPQLGMATPRRAPASPAVLYAVIALLEELDESQLGIVAREVGERICRPV